jgi:hypothetical protein
MAGMVAMLPSDIVVVPGETNSISMEDLMCVRKKEMDEMKLGRNVRGNRADGGGE